MKLTPLLFIFLLFFGSLSLCAQAQTSMPLLALADVSQDNEFEEDDPMQEESDEDDPLADSDEVSKQEENREHFPKVITKNFYRLALGSKNLTQEGFATGSYSEKEEKASLVNAFEIETKILYSKDVSTVFNFGLVFLQEYDSVQDRYTDEGNFVVNESYVHVDRGDFNYKLGALKFDNGPLDLDSPSNVLTMSNSVAFNSFDINNLTKPFIGGQYSRISENSTLSFTASLLKPETAGSEYTRYLELATQRDDNESVEDYSELAAHAGIRYSYNFSAFNIALASYYWFDKDTQITWTDTSENNLSLPNYSDTYTERITDTLFYGLDFDMSIGTTILKGEFYYFVDKNNYSYLDMNNSKVFTTVNTDMLSSAVSLEKISGDLFIMGVYSYKKLYNVPGQTHILGFENDTIISNEIRDLESQKFSLICNYKFSKNVKALISLSQNITVPQTTLVAALDYAMSDKETLGLKSVYLDVQEHKSTSSKLNTQQVFIDYVYHF